MKRAAPPSPGRPSPLDRYRKDLAACVRCGLCRTVCPPAVSARGESFTARGRMALAQAVLDGTLRPSAAFKDRLMTCTGCLACEAACPGGVPVTTIIEAAREQTARDRGPSVLERVLPAVLSGPSALRMFGRLMPAVLRVPLSGTGVSLLPFPSRPFTETVPAVISRKKGAAVPRGLSRVVLFSGCAINHVQKDIAQSAVRVLTALGIEVVIPKGEICCGRPLLSLGRRDRARDVALRTASLLSRLGVDAVVTACASCGLTFKREYPALLSGSFLPPVLDIHEVLADLLPAVRLAPLDRHATFHVPCHLGRGQGLAAAARKVLRGVPGVRLIEMKNADECCGFGGVMRMTHPALSAAVGAEKAANIQATGAGVVVTGCPGCRFQISAALRRAGSAAKVVHTVQLVDQAIRR